jgi:hypothetical protein
MEGGSRSVMAEKVALEAKVCLIPFCGVGINIHQCTGLEGLVSDLQRQNRALSDQVNQLELHKCDIRAQMDDTLAEYPQSIRNFPLRNFVC